MRGHLVGYVAGAPGQRAFLRKLNGLISTDLILEAVREAWTPPPGGHVPGPTRSGASV